MMGIIVDFGEFLPARSFAKPIFRYVVRVSVIVAPEGILLLLFTWRITAAAAQEQ